MIGWKIVPILEGGWGRQVMRDQKDSVYEQVGPHFPVCGSPCSHPGSQSPHLLVNPPLENFNHLSLGLLQENQGLLGEGLGPVFFFPQVMSQL